MARVSRKWAPAPDNGSLVLPYGCAEAATPEPSVEQVEAAPAPQYRTPPATTPRVPFGTWLLKQDLRDGWIGILAKGAKTDRAFPKQGDPDAVRKRLGETGAEADMFEAVDDAEREWLSA